MLAPLFALIYTSMMELEESPTCIANILRAARHHNERAGITGLLVFDGLHFCQYLEGPEQAVLQLIERIRQDKRHVAFSMQEQGPFDGPRRFAGRSMGYALAINEEELPALIAADHSSSAIARFLQLLPKLSLDPSPV